MADFRGGLRGAHTTSSGSKVESGEDFYRLSKALKGAGRTELRKELHKGLRQGAKPLTKVAKQAAGEAFPKRGGLARREARAKFRAQVKTGRDPGVQINAEGKYVNIKLANTKGVIRHPVFADATKTRREWEWRTQPVPGAQGWFDKAMKDHADEVRPALEQAVQRVIDTIVKEAS